MATENNPNHYNYHRLDEFLKKEYSSQEIGNHLDQVRDKLVELVHYREDYSKELREEHYLLGALRDIFWNLKKDNH